MSAWRAVAAGPTEATHTSSAGRAAGVGRWRSVGGLAWPALGKTPPGAKAEGKKRKRNEKGKKRRKTTALTQLHRNPRMGETPAVTAGAKHADSQETPTVCHARHDRGTVRPYFCAAKEETSSSISLSFSLSFSTNWLCSFCDGEHPQRPHTTMEADEQDWTGVRGGREAVTAGVNPSRECTEESGHRRSEKTVERQWGAQRYPRPPITTADVHGGQHARKPSPRQQSGTGHTYHPSRKAASP